jgi:hypothetical protein
MLASTLIQTAYRLAGIQEEAGRQFSPSQGTEGLQVLNSLLDQWQTQRLFVLVISRLVFPVVPNQASYTVGPLGDISINRPEKLWGAGYVFTDVDPEVEVPLECWNDQNWKANTIKSFTSPIPYAAYYQADFDINGCATLYLWPIPTNNANFVLYVWSNGILNQVPSLSTNLVFPPGYQNALEMNLAVEIAARFPRAKLSPLTIEIAKSSKSWVKNVNAPVIYQVADAGSGGMVNRRGGWSILTGCYGDGTH